MTFFWYTYKRLKALFLQSYNRLDKHKLNFCDKICKKSWLVDIFICKKPSKYLLDINFFLSTDPLGLSYRSVPRMWSRSHISYKNISHFLHILFLLFSPPVFFALKCVLMWALKGNFIPRVVLRQKNTYQNSNKNVNWNFWRMHFNKKILIKVAECENDCAELGSDGGFSQKESKNSKNGYS